MLKIRKELAPSKPVQLPGNPTDIPKNTGNPRESSSQVGDETAATSETPRNASLFFHDTSSMTPMASIRAISSALKKQVLNMELACHDDSGSDNQSPTLQEQITALAKASNGHNADLLKLNTLNAEVHDIKISLADNTDFSRKSCEIF